MSEQSAENAAGCHPLMVCTDRPELCPPACRPVVRNAGANDMQPAENDAPTCPHVTIPRSCFTCGTGRFARVIPPEEG